MLKNLINGYFANSLTPSELSELVDLLQNIDNQKVFEKYAKEYYDINLSFQEVKVDQEYLMLMKQVRRNQRFRKPLIKKWYKVAAIFIGLVGLGYLVFLTSHDPPEKTMIEENAITITLEDGTKKVIREDGNEVIIGKNGRVVGKQERTKLDYKVEEEGKETERLTERIAYNELAIPYGKVFKLLLSDGTLVHLNAGTSIRYPVKFLEGNREVSVNGEAYFEVAKDENRPFIVNTEDINLRVLGTKFNVNSYNENSAINTILVEGSVGLYTKDQIYSEDTSVVLAPGQIAVWEKSEKSIQVEEVDVSEYIAWTEGVLMFKIRPFSEIVKVLERHYNVTIINNYRFLDDQRFFAKFDTETIEQVLISFQNSQPFSFEINEDQIIINEP